MASMVMEGDKARQFLMGLRRVGVRSWLEGLITKGSGAMMRPTGPRLRRCYITFKWGSRAAFYYSSETRTEIGGQRDPSS